MLKQHTFLLVPMMNTPVRDQELPELSAALDPKRLAASLANDPERLEGVVEQLLAKGVYDGALIAELSSDVFLKPLELQPSLLARLLSAGCDINACDKCGFAAIDYAAAGNMIEYARLLVRHGAHFPMKYAWQVRKEGLADEVVSRFPFDALNHSENPNVLHIVKTRFYVRLVGDELPWRLLAYSYPEATCNLSFPEVALHLRSWRPGFHRQLCPSIQRCFKAVMLCNERWASRNEISLHPDVWGVIFGLTDLADPAWPRLDLAPPTVGSDAAHGPDHIQRRVREYTSDANLWAMHKAWRGTVDFYDRVVDATEADACSDWVLSKIAEENDGDTKSRIAWSVAREFGRKVLREEYKQRGFEDPE